MQQTKIPAEITVKGVALALFLVVILGAANAYLGLKVGLTVSASIPAAVISMGLLRLFRENTILENNIVQTAASAGEALTSGVAFTLPALIVLGTMDHFSYWPAFLAAFIGGTIGVLFSVPIRRALLNDKSLPFPEGTAIGNILKISETESSGVRFLSIGGLVGAAISFMQTGLNVIASQAQWATQIGGMLFSAGCGFSPSLLGAGYIIGVRLAISFTIGIVMGWLVVIPWLSLHAPLANAGDFVASANALWTHHLRFVGIGITFVGGVHGVLVLIKPLIMNLRTRKTSEKMANNNWDSTPRTERDMPLHIVKRALAIAALPLFFAFYFFLSHFASDMPVHLMLLTSTVCVVLFLTLGFALSAVCAYFAGLVGSSSNPLSGLGLIGLISSALVLLVLLGHKLSVEMQLKWLGVAAMYLTVIFAASAAICNETIQDLKAGQIVGATPWKQQLMMQLGVLVSAATLPWVLQLLFDAYGIGNVFPHPGMDPQQMLQAPQATLMATVLKAIFTHELNWPMLILGMITAAVLIVANHFLRPRDLHISVLGVGLGLYLPFASTVPLALGGYASYFTSRKTSESQHHRAILLACGLVAGSAVMGVVLAVPFVIAGSSDVLYLVGDSFSTLSNVLALASLAFLYWLLRWSTKAL